MKRGGRSVALSLKPRSAVTLTGHKATAVLWFDDRGGWTTSTAFTPGPVPFLQAFIDANPITADYDKVWERTLPLSAYQGQDDMKGEGKVAGWSTTFPHPLAVPGGKVDADFYARWQRSPYADEYLGRMAAASIDALKLGQGSTTDFLGVSFSATDGVGHVYGPRSHEIQDLLVRLDRTIGKLIEHLDTAVGPGNYVLGLSADHGVSEIPEQIGGGRVSSKSRVDGPAGRPRSRARTGDARALVHLHEHLPGRPARQASLEGQGAARGRVQGAPDRGRRRVRVLGTGSRDERRRARRATAYAARRRSATFPGRSGDIIIAPKEKWLMSTAVTTHGSQYSYDQRVPVILFGASVRAGRYTGAATPADLMPTLAAVAKVKIAKTDGHVLTEAIR